MEASRALYFLLVVGAVLLPFLIHVFLTRGLRLFREKALRQKGAILAVLLGYPFSGAGFMLWALILPPPGIAILPAGLALFLIYSGFAYTYFHLFNMSETARRIRILSRGVQRGELGREEMAGEYTGEGMVRIRLERLAALREIEFREGRYRPGRLYFLLPARIVFACRRVIFPPASAPLP